MKKYFSKPPGIEERLKELPPAEPKTERLVKKWAAERGIPVEDMLEYDMEMLKKHSWIESEEVISEPGAGIKITALKLTPAAQQALSVGNAVLPPHRREDMKLVKAEERLSDVDKQEIAELQARNLMPFVYTICAGLIAYAGLVLYVALVS